MHSFTFRAFLSRLVFAALSISTLFVTPACVHAQKSAFAWTSAINTNYLDPSSYNLGIRFTTTSNITVTALGYFDSYANNGQLTGLKTSHDVGIYNLAGTLLTSATVDAGTTDTLIDSYRYKYIAPLQLTVGQTYTMVGVTIGNQDPYAYGITGVTTAPGISINPSTAAYISGGATLANPTGYYGDIYTGPNILVSTAAVPELSSLIGFGSFVAIGGLAAFRQRKQARKAV